MRLLSPSQRGWALSLLVLVVAAVLRFWQLGDAPPGLYRDEAYNGLDALEVLQGNHSLFFTTNNGREPAYIYLTALSIAIFGRTVLAVRLAAAVVGTVTTYIVYRLASTWFNKQTGFFAAWLWAVTLWPVHLSRIGLRPILLAPLLAFTFWLGTKAFRRQNAGLWLATGVVYGAAFYTYLAVRFTPLFLALLLSYLLLSCPDARKRLWPGVFLFSLGALIVVLPLALYASQHPDLFLGRAQQVSILNPSINEGNLPGKVVSHTVQALGMFLWQGDTILRHNPAGRPVFDLFMLVPFLIGFIWSVRHWRQPAAMALLLWVAVMLGPTILAEDTPHFLRASGLLPAVLFIPALGLSKLWEWPKLPGALRQGLVLLLASGTLISTVTDYANYVRQPETAYLFEAAARELAQEMNAEPVDVTIFADRRFWEGWPSLSYLVRLPQRVHLFTPEEGLEETTPPVTIYAWPYARLEFIPAALMPPAVVSVDVGSLARGDLEPAAYPLYVRYGAVTESLPPEKASFGEQTSGPLAGHIALRDIATTLLSPDDLQVDLYWSAEAGFESSLVSFVHVVNAGNLVAQSDEPLAGGFWPVAAWRPGLVVRDRHIIELEEPYDFTRHEVFVGLYEATTLVRLPVSGPTGESAGDMWLLEEKPRKYEE